MFTVRKQLFRFNAGEHTERMPFLSREDEMLKARDNQPVEVVAYLTGENQYGVRFEDGHQGLVFADELFTLDTERDPL